MGFTIDTWPNLKIRNPALTTYDPTLLEKIKSPPLERQAEVEDFVEFLRLKEERQLKQAALKLAEISFANVWDNPEDSVYDSV